MRGASRAPFVVALGLLLALAGAALAAYRWADGQIHAAARSGRAAATIDIPNGSSISSIADILHRAGVIDSTLVFELYVRIGGHHHLEAGSYKVPGNYDMAHVVALLEHNLAGPEVTVTVPEGYTDKQIAQLLEQKRLFAQPLYLAAERLPTWNQDFLAGRPASSDLEGFLFPDTYAFATDAKPETVIQAQLKRFGEKVPADIRARATANGVSFYQALTLASIIEREAKLNIDRPWIASVFYNRLQKGIALEVDATILYAEGRTGGDITDQDKTFNSPYNTYLHVGIPPGPISNPGIPSIMAALTPAPNLPYLFYFTDSSGKAHFSKTFPQHQQCQANFSLCVTAS